MDWLEKKSARFHGRPRLVRARQDSPAKEEDYQYIENKNEVGQLLVDIWALQDHLELLLYVRSCPICKDSKLSDVFRFVSNKDVQNVISRLRGQELFKIDFSIRQVQDSLSKELEIIEVPLLRRQFRI